MQLDRRAHHRELTAVVRTSGGRRSAHHKRQRLRRGAGAGNVSVVAEQWFLKLDGIEGESTNAAHKNEIDVESWSWGITQAGSSGFGGGGGSGKAAFQDMHFVARISKASPKLFLSCATGVHHKVATLSGRRTAGKGKTVEFLKYKLSDVQVTGVQHSDSEAGTPMEQFSLQYSKLEMSYSPQATSGKLGAAVTANFNVLQNKKI